MSRWVKKRLGLKPSEYFYYNSTLCYITNPEITIISSTLLKFITFDRKVQDTYSQYVCQGQGQGHENYR